MSLPNETGYALENEPCAWKWEIRESEENAFITDPSLSENLMSWYN